MAVQALFGRGAGIFGACGLAAGLALLGCSGPGPTGDGVGGRGSGGSGAGGSSTLPPGTCCAGGNCICRDAPPAALTDRNGRFRVANFSIAGRGRVYYPTDATPPFAGVAVCGGFLNTGPEMNNWGTFYASYGIVTIITNTGAADLPDLRGTKLNAAITALKAENTRAGSPLQGKMTDRYGTSGYSMGGGGTTIAARLNPSLKTSVALAPWGPVGGGTVPSLFFCGGIDAVAPCEGAQGAYAATNAQKMAIVIPTAEHLLSWFGPRDAGAGEAALAFQKLFLEGDERWKPLLLRARFVSNTNIR